MLPGSRLEAVLQKLSFFRYAGFHLPDSLFKIVLMHVQALMQPVRIVPNGQRTEDTLLSRK